MTADISMHETPTGASVGHAPPPLERTRTISELVDDVGFLRNRSELLLGDSHVVHEEIGRLHSDALEEELNSLTALLTRERLTTLLDQLSAFGLSWRDIARISGVSVPAVRKWRRGESAATPDNRMRVARCLALCRIATDRFHVDDIAGWLEVPLRPQAPITGLDLMSAERFDLLLILTRDQPDNPSSVLDEFEPDWRTLYHSEVEVFTAPDGQPGLRLSSRER